MLTGRNVRLSNLLISSRQGNRARRGDSVRAAT